MPTATYVPDWKETVVFSPDGPRPQVLSQDDKVKVVLAGLEAGQGIPPHAESRGVFHCLEGNGWITVDDDRLPFTAGVTVVVPEGASRGIEAVTRLAFLVTRVS